ncbi:MAG: response regulator [Ignavibacteriaceae bacterium]
MKSETNNIKPKLLIIEDDFENQKLLEIYLKRKFDITICDSESTFHKCLNEDSYDIFLVDIALRSGKNGLELTQELRGSDKYSSAPIVCISAHVFPKDRENAFAAGVDEFLPRPIFNEELLNSLIKTYEKKTGAALQ